VLDIFVLTKLKKLNSTKSRKNIQNTREISTARDRSHRALAPNVPDRKGGAMASPHPKKHELVRAAIQLFAENGFDGTTTLRIAKAAGVTEPLIYYHFANKDGLFTYILEKAFNDYFNRLEQLPDQSKPAFHRIETLISLHMEISAEKPEETYLIASTCPAKLKDGAHACSRLMAEQRKRLSRYLGDCLKQGVESGEFAKLNIPPTVNVLLVLILGIMRQHALGLDTRRGMRKAAVDFCRRSLMA
jgi:AcrR family transcriptional regulator